MGSSDSHDGQHGATTRTNMSSVVFDRVVGSISADIEPEDFLGKPEDDSEVGTGSSNYVDSAEMDSLEDKEKIVDPLREVDELGFGRRASSNTLRGLDTVEEVA